MRTENKIWIGIFLLWSLFLSGILQEMSGSTGLLQLVELKNFLEIKQHESETLRERLKSLEEASLLLENNRAAQLREIRKVLGYIAPDEIVFDFSQDLENDENHSTISPSHKVRQKND